MKTPTEELMSVTLSLNTQIPGTPLFDSLLGMLDQKRLPEFEPWNPDYQPTHAWSRMRSEFDRSCLVTQQRVVEMAEEITSQAATSLAAVVTLHTEALGVLDDLYHQIILDLGLTETAPERLDDATMNQLGQILDAHSQGQVEEIRDALAGSALASLQVDGETIEARHEIDGVPGQVAITYHTPEVDAVMLPSRNALRNSCATCFPRECDLENPRSACRRTAPPVSAGHAVDFQPSEAARRFVASLQRGEPVIVFPPEDDAFVDDLSAEEDPTPHVLVDHDGTPECAQGCPGCLMEGDGPIDEELLAAEPSESEAGTACTGRVDCAASGHVSGCFAHTLDVSSSVGRHASDQPTKSFFGGVRNILRSRREERTIEIPPPLDGTVSGNLPEAASAEAE